MKKISVLLLSILTFGISLTSCDMDTKPAANILADEYAKTPKDFNDLRVTLYAPLRGFFSGGIVSMPDVMTDNFNAVDGFSNAWGDIYRWQFTSATGDFGGLFASAYSIIGHCNYILDSAAKLTDKELVNFSEKDLNRIKTIIGESYYIRSLMYFYMTQYYCEDYEENIADTPDMGLPLQLTFNPTDNNAEYPARSTMRETYAQIELDLDSAATRIKRVSGEGWITEDCITALRARVALSKDDYAKAAEYATELVDGGEYTLACDDDEIEDMWHEGRGGDSEEFIFKLPIPSKEEMASANGTNFLPNLDGVSTIVDYVPSGSLYDLYDEDDYRRDVYFKPYNIIAASGGSARVKLFNKYPEITSIYEEFKPNGRFQNEPVVFRIAEFYLIAAEAYARMGMVEKGAEYLNELQENRIYDFQDRTYANADELMQEVKNERRREYAVEGTRLIDLKRWHDPIIRGDQVQDMSICHFPGNKTTTNLYVPANDPRMTWPIPQQEIDANPKVKQNRGYLN